MFCKHCGKEVADGAKFCAACGQPTGEAPRTSGTGLPPIVDSFVSQLKALVNPTEGIGLAAKCPDFTGVIGIGLYYLIYVFYNAVSAYQSDYTSSIVGFGGMFGISCAMGAIYLALLAIAYFGTCFVAQGGMPNLASCVNSFGYALVPATFAMVLNFGLGFVWDPLASFVSTIGTVFLYLALYVAVQKMEAKPVRSYFWVFCVAIAFAVVLANFINGEIYSAYINSCLRSPSWW